MHKTQQHVLRVVTSNPAARQLQEGSSLAASRQQAGSSWAAGGKRVGSARTALYLGEQDGQNGLRVDEVWRAQVVNPAGGKDLGACLEPHRLAEVDATEQLQQLQGAKQERGGKCCVPLFLFLGHQKACALLSLLYGR